MGFRLRIVQGKGVGREFQFSKAEVSVGRAPDNDLVLYDMGVSRHHCLVVQEGGDFTLRDAGSANGTLLNDLVTTEARVRQGDRIQVGPVAFILEPLSPEQAAQSGSRHELVLHPEQGQDSDGNTIFAASLPADETAGNRTQPQPTSVPVSPEVSTFRTKTGSFLAHRRVSWWSLQSFKELPPSTKIALGLSLLIVAAGVVISIYIAQGESLIDRSAEVFTLADDVNAGKSFGAGKVQVYTPDRLNFQFDYQGGRATVIYAAGGIDTPTEVELLLNGKPAGFVEPTPGGWRRGLKTVLPHKLLKPGMNVLTFDNTMTPARAERWGIAQVRLTEEPLPQPSEEKARALLKLGDAAFDARSVAPGNLRRAIEQYEQAQLYVEAMDPPSPLFDQAIKGQEQARAELNRIFGEGKFSAQRSVRFDDVPSAIDILNDLLSYFPDPEDRRHAEIKAMLAELQSRPADKPEAE